MAKKLKCQNECGRDAEYFSLGGTVLCKICADEMGLVCGESNKIEHFAEYQQRKRAAQGVKT